MRAIGAIPAYKWRPFGLNQNTKRFHWIFNATTVISSIKTKALKMKSPLLLLLNNVYNKVEKKKSCSNINGDDAGGQGGWTYGWMVGGPIAIAAWPPFHFLYSMYMRVYNFILLVRPNGVARTYTHGAHTRTASVTSTFNCCWRLSRNVIRAAAMRVHWLPPRFTVKMCEWCFWCFSHTVKSRYNRY